MSTGARVQTREQTYKESFVLENIPDTVSRGTTVQIREQTYKGSFVLENIPDTVSRGAKVQINVQGIIRTRQYPGYCKQGSKSTNKRTRDHSY